MSDRELDYIADGLADDAYEWHQKLLPYLEDDEHISIPPVPLMEGPEECRELVKQATEALEIEEFENLFTLVLTKDGIHVSCGDSDWEYPLHSTRNKLM